MAVVTPCSICARPDRHPIDERLASGAPFRRIAAEHGCGKDAVARHARRCLAVRGEPSAPKTRAAAKKRVDRKIASLVPVEVVLDAPSDVDRETVGLLSRTLGVLERAEATGDTRGALAAIREARSILELAAKRHGMLGSDGVPTIDASVTNITTYLGKLTDEQLDRIVHGESMKMLPPAIDGELAS